MNKLQMLVGLNQFIKKEKRLYTCLDQPGYMDRKYVLKKRSNGIACLA